MTHWLLEPQARLPTATMVSSFLEVLLKQVKDFQAKLPKHMEVRLPNKYLEEVQEAQIRVLMDFQVGEMEAKHHKASTHLQQDNRSSMD